MPQSLDTFPFHVSVDLVEVYVNGFEFAHKVYLDCHVSNSIQRIFYYQRKWYGIHPDGIYQDGKKIDLQVEWDWSGPSIPSKEVHEQMRCVLVWKFEESPGMLRAQSLYGGDEEHIFLLPCTYSTVQNNPMDRIVTLFEVRYDEIQWGILPDGRSFGITAHS
jgi:hypothetical protein